VATIAVDPLIAEARRRARRRRLGYALLACIAAALAAGTLLPRHAPAPSAAAERAAVARAAAHTTIGEAGVVAANAVWAMNGIGLWYTTDGGARWRTITPPRVRGQDVVARIVQIQFVDPAHGWASGSDIPGGPPTADGGTRSTMLFRTTDGGRTWFHTRANCAGCGGTLSFLDRDDGFTLAGTTLYRTHDGGVTWRRVAATSFRGWIEFIDARRGWAASWFGGGLYRTVDGGRTWKLVVRGQASLPQQGLAAVRVHRRAYLVETRTLRRLPLPDGDPGQAPMFSAPTARDVVYWARGRLWASSDGGASWTRIRSKVPPRQVWDLQFTSARRGWAIFGDALVRTTDGGRDWTPLTPPVPRVKAFVPKPPCNSPCRRP
jgi:photosystem II stability/assembly factor-like uncharacterized protein